MNKTKEHSANQAADSIQQRLTSYAFDLKYDSFSPAALHATKVRVIDTLGALIGGFFSEPCHIARNLASQMPNLGGATVIGTRMKTAVDMAAFVNATTARSVEMNDGYFWPGSSGGHPSDMVTPILAAAEHARISGREFLTCVALAYETYLRIADAVVFPGFDCTNFVCLGTAVAVGKLLELSPTQLSHCISMAVVPNVILRQVRSDYLSMFKAVAAGHAGRAGVFAALLAQAGMEGPHLPFEGKAGWCEHVSHKRFSLDTMGGNGTPFKVQDTLIKLRPCCAGAISCVLAAEKVAPLKNIEDVKQVTVEVYKKAKKQTGTGEHCWNPDSREAADHSAPYLVAVTLIDGTVTPRSFDDARLWNPALRALMQKIEIVEDEEFTKAFEKLPVEQHTRVTVLTNNGERRVGETGGGEDDPGAQETDEQIAQKFRSLTEDVLGAKRVKAILDRLWNLEDMVNVAEIPPAFVFC